MKMKTMSQMLIIMIMSTDICSYHVNVGHGNCSIIAFRKEGRSILWLVDCSVRETTYSSRNYASNLDKCLTDI